MGSSKKHKDKDREHRHKHRKHRSHDRSRSRSRGRRHGDDDQPKEKRRRHRDELEEQYDENMDLAQPPAVDTVDDYDENSAAVAAAPQSPVSTKQELTNEG